MKRSLSISLIEWSWRESREQLLNPLDVDLLPIHKNIFHTKALCKNTHTQTLHQKHDAYSDLRNMHTVLTRKHIFFPNYDALPPHSHKDCRSSPCQKMTSLRPVCPPILWEMLREGRTVLTALHFISIDIAVNWISLGYQEHHPRSSLKLPLLSRSQTGGNSKKLFSSGVC